jgi:hypothetical protein
MPPPQPPRPGLEQIIQQGEVWEAEKLDDLTRTFGSDAIIGDAFRHSSGQIRYNGISLETALTSATPRHFLIQAQYAVGSTFEQALAIESLRTTFNLNYAEVRPDIIQVLSARHFSQSIKPSGEIQALPASDTRLQLRIIDIKLTAEPSPSYFAEVTYYAMVLAGWLVDHGFDQHYVVVPDCAIWAGSHEASNLTVTNQSLMRQGITATTQQLQAAMEQDLELVPFPVFVITIHRFLTIDVPDVLSQNWRDLPWHVDNRCRGCENLGYPWLDRDGNRTDHEDHCIPMAETEDHLSRVAFMSRGASSTLRLQGITDVASLATRNSSDAVFEAHHTLRATRTVVAGRAASLQSHEAAVPPDSGSSALMPRWTDLRIYLSVDFDLGSAITFALGLKAFWVEPRAFGAPDIPPRQTQAWERVRIVDARDINAERRELLAFLNQINDILVDARSRQADTTVQFYIWDSLQYDHLCRIIGRHLQAILQNADIQRLAWLFPSEEIVPNPDMSTRRSPVTIVRDVVRSVLAAPIPHYYTLLNLARSYHNSDLPERVARFSVHPLFEDELSDQIPSERAHAIWARSPSWLDTLNTLTETVQRRLRALEEITKQLEIDLRPLLEPASQTAPPIANIGPPDRQNRLSYDSQLWYAFARLNAALEGLEVHKIRAMPPHEREARFHSARLERRLVGDEERNALSQLGLQPTPTRRVYRMHPTSAEVKLREGDFNFALAPEQFPGFLDRTLGQVTQGRINLQPNQAFSRMESVTQVTVAAIDRDHHLIALDENRRWPGWFATLEAQGLVDFSTDIILDPVYHDYFTRKLLAALRAIGNPPLARANPLVMRATGQLAGRGARQSATTPPAELLWSARQMHDVPVGRVLPPVRAALEAHGLLLNASQWTAWEQALSRRLQLIWGPPGTGKSRTARAIIAGAVLEAHQQNRPLRVLICASTYNAMDNVLLPAYGDVQSLLGEQLTSGALQVCRLRSYLHTRENDIPAEIDVELNRRNPSQQVRNLRTRLVNANQLTIVGATPEQTHNLLTIADNSAQDELFDLILIDEASQMDVAHAILALCSLTENGSVVLAGDPRQLPPIHQANPPVGLENMVGPIYVFCSEFHQVPDVMLSENYRSNSTLVEFSLNAGYRRTLSSYSPDLRLDLIQPVPVTQPADWATDIYWTPEWATLLDPAYPAVCFTYPEGRSSQWNQFEADAVAALVTLLQGRLSNQLLNERDSRTGALIRASVTPYSNTEFWDNAIGVVTPHRAQQGLIVDRLQRIYVPGGVSPQIIRGAVDTVERFQGQQRDVIIATFALGDPDQIREEDEFLMSLNRFNVMASRARAKLIVLVSEEVVYHLSSDLDVLRESGLLKLYVESFCQHAHQMTLGLVERGVPRPIVGTYRYR